MDHLFSWRAVAPAEPMATGFSPLTAIATSLRNLSIWHGASPAALLTTPKFTEDGSESNGCAPSFVLCDSGLLIPIAVRKGLRTLPFLQLPAASVLLRSTHGGERRAVPLMQSEGKPVAREGFGNNWRKSVFQPQARTLLPNDEQYRVAALEDVHDYMDRLSGE